MPRILVPGNDERGGLGRRGEFVKPNADIRVVRRRGEERGERRDAGELAALSVGG
jgi:hypothetical protein